MDISGIDIGAMGTAIAAVLKALHTDRKANAIGAERDELKRDYAERFVKVETKQENLEKRLDDCFAKFDSIDEQLREMNRTLSELTGIIKSFTSKPAVQVLREA